MDRGDPDDEEASRDYTALWPHIPFVEHLDLESPVRMRDLKLPRLKHLGLNGPRYNEVLVDLMKAELPQLASLALSENHWHFDAFDPAWPKLQRLDYICPPTTLENARWLFVALARSPLVRRVRVLDLSLTVNAANASILAEHAASLLHLHELHVGGTCDELDRALGSRVKVAK